jgi:hypothetical protein
MPDKICTSMSFLAGIFEADAPLSENAQMQALESTSENSKHKKVSAGDGWTRAFSATEIVLSSIILVAVCFLLMLGLSHYPYYTCCYEQISGAIRHWDFRDMPSGQPKELWGLPYLSALIATITRLPDFVALALISSCMYVVSNCFCYRLWGSTVAAWFLAGNYWWLDSAVNGMSESLFMVLLLGSFLAVRKERWTIAVILASGATVVRPVGIFALVALGTILLVRRDVRRLAWTIGIGLGSGVLYLLPMALIYGDPFANIRGYYSGGDISGSLPISIPLVSLIRQAVGLSSQLRPWLQILLATWVLIILAGAVNMAVNKRFWRYSKEYPVEALFAGLYVLYLFCWDAVSGGGWAHFPRYAIPLVPFVALVLLHRLPRDRRVLWSVALANVMIVVIPKAGHRHVLELIRDLI